MSKIKGSQWRKWDLHFHTPTSYDYGNKSISNQDLIDGLAAKEISVVAITDHHRIDIDRITELQKLGLNRGITVLPGIEFLADARGAEPVHFIGIFPESSNINFIWKQIESRTDIHKIESEGRKNNEVYCHLLDTAKLIRELGGLVTIHAGSKSNTIDNITHSLPHGVAQKVDIAEVIDIFEIGKEEDCSGYNEHVIPFLKTKINKHIPLIICSDNHHINDYVIKQNLWIKADQTFEGLKQIIFEPEHRVKIQKEKPDFKEERLVIDEIRFISATGKFNPEPICLNDNLNVIIGGKSSGKSILLYNIAKTLLADADFLKKEKIENKYDFREDDTDYNFEIKTKGGFSQLMFRDKTINSIIPEIKYIPQNYLVKLAEPEENKSGNALNKIIRDLINEDLESKQAYDAFILKVKANDRIRENAIENYFSIKDRIQQLKSELKLKTNKEILEKNILSNTQKAEDLNKSTGMTDEQIAEYNKLQNDLEDIKLKRTSIFNDYKKATGFNSEISTTLNALRTRKQLFINSLENADLKKYLEDGYSVIDNTVNQIDELSEKFERIKDEQENNKWKIISSVSKIFDEITDAYIALEVALQPFLKNAEIKNQIVSILQSIGEDRAALQSINQLGKEISENEKALEDEKKAIFKLYRENFKEYTDVISALKLRTIDLEKDGLKIEGLALFNFPKFRKAIYDFSDSRKAHYNRYKIYTEENDPLVVCNLEKVISDLNAIFISIAEVGDYALTSKTNTKNAIKILLDDYFFDYWEIEYKKDRLGKMSTGKASFVILMLIVGLSKSKAPILIDQPEDNLDNRSITSDLVEYLKNKKLERQIILVTHNANIVVNADAENIIIAHQKGQGDVETLSPYQFDYINGALENSFAQIEEEKNLLKSMGIREHIADIVEGGKIAFKKREEKYGF